MTFAKLSSAAILLPLTAACGSGGSEGGRAAYGVVAPLYGAPVGTTMVTGIYFLDAHGNRTLLAGSTGVPVDASFEVTFSADMLSTSPYFVETGVARGVQYAVSWPDLRTAKIVPASNLKSATQYALDIYNAVDSNGYRIQMVNNTATFTTA